jgi:hypothetical protein
MFQQLEKTIQKSPVKEINPQKSTSMLRRLLPEYNQHHKFIKFQLNNNYEVYLRVCDEKAKPKPSMIDKIPVDVFKNHILVYFSSFDLFKLREVCSEWRD